MIPISRKILLPGLLSLGLLGGCTSSLFDFSKTSRSHAFITYRAPPKDGSLRLAVKDLIDVRGMVTSAGASYLATTRAPAERDADCLRLARQRNVTIVGKTNLTELAVTVSGRNAHFGTPVNRPDGKSKVIPGGSSSGSAVAVEMGMADIAFGTDTGGSIRVPAACCGVYGLKTTFGLVSTRGVFPVSPKHLDTIGPMANTLPRLVQGMDLLQEGFAARYESAVAENPSARQIRIGRFYVGGTDPAIDTAIDHALVAKGFKIIKLKPAFRKKWEQAEKDGKTVALADAWRNSGQYLDRNGIGLVTKLVLLQGEWESTNQYKEALKRKARWQRDLGQIFEQVDFIALPTLQGLPPAVPWFGSAPVFEWQVYNMQNTIAVNLAGNPALAVPIPMPPKGRRTPVTSLQLIGPRLSEAELLNVGRLLAADE